MIYKMWRKSGENNVVSTYEALDKTSDELVKRTLSIFTKVDLKSIGVFVWEKNMLMYYV